MRHIIKDERVIQTSYLYFCVFCGLFWFEIVLYGIFSWLHKCLKSWINKFWISEVSADDTRTMIVTIPFIFATLKRELYIQRTNHIKYCETSRIIPTWKYSKKFWDLGADISSSRTYIQPKRCSVSTVRVHSCIPFESLRPVRCYRSPRKGILFPHFSTNEFLRRGIPSFVRPLANTFQKCGLIIF